MTATPEPVKHPATYSPGVIHAMATILNDEANRLDIDGDQLTVLDPMAGTGGVHALRGRTTGVELEPEWANQHPGTKVGDATALPFTDGVFNVVARLARLRQPDGRPPRPQGRLPPHRLQVRPGPHAVAQLVGRSCTTARSTGTCT